MGCGLKIYPREIIEEKLAALFPEKTIEADKESYEEYIESERSLYSLIMTEEELDIHFPRP